MNILDFNRRFMRIEEELALFPDTKIANPGWWDVVRFEVMSQAKAVVGNSSSGLVEASSLGVPAVNIENRQKNRLAAESVLHVSYVPTEIESALAHVLTPKYQDTAKACTNPYDPFRDGKNSLRIVKALEYALVNHQPSKLRIKKFETTVQPDTWNTLLKESN